MPTPLLTVALTLLSADPRPTPVLPAQVTSAITADNTRALMERLCSFGNRHTASDPAHPTRGIEASRQWIMQELNRVNAMGTGRMKVELEAFDQGPTDRLPNGAKIVNVIATLPGAMPEAAQRRYYVVGHNDTINSDRLDAVGDAPGANDDASGVVAVMEIARVLAKHQLDSTIVFLATAGEEQGLLGARLHAEAAATRGDDIRGVLNNDIIGDPSPAAIGADGKPIRTRTMIRVFSEGIPSSPRTLELEMIKRLAAESDSPSRQLARYIADVARREKTAIQPMLVFRTDRFLRGGDHLAFNERGFAAVRFTTVGEDYNRQHQTTRTENGINYGDTPDHIDHDYLAHVTRLNAATLIHLANAPSTPPNARIITANLTTDTTIKWDASPEPDTAGYEVVWRDTTAPDWQYSKDVGNTLELTLPISKDNVFFGVRAYDKEGYTSPVSFPIAAKE